MRQLLAVLTVVLAVAVVACGQGDEEEPSPTPTSQATAPLIFREASYTSIDTLSLDALAPDEVEEMGKAGAGGQTVGAVYGRKSGGVDWEVLTSSADGWTVWQPTAVTLATADLAERLKVAKEEVKVQQVERLQWSDSCLGAAQPGEVCAQVITDGFKIILSAEGQGYEYHSNLDDMIRPVF